MGIPIISRKLYDQIYLLRQKCRYWHLKQNIVFENLFVLFIKISLCLSLLGTMARTQQLYSEGSWSLASHGPQWVNMMNIIDNRHHAECSLVSSEQLMKWRQMHAAHLLLHRMERCGYRCRHSNRKVIILWRNFRRWIWRKFSFWHLPMMTSSNGNIFRVTGHLRGEFTGPRWIPRKKASDAELWCFF